MTKQGIVLIHYSSVWHILCSWRRLGQVFEYSLLFQEISFTISVSVYILYISSAYIWYQYIIYICCCSVAKLCLTLCDPMDSSTPGSSVLLYLWEFAQMHVHWVNDAIYLFHPLPPPPPFAFNLSQHQSLFQWVGSSPIDI